MKKSEAKSIVEAGVTNGQIKDMLKDVYDAGAANGDRARINSTLSKASAFNIFWTYYRDKGISEGVIYAIQINVLMEFGEFWGGKKPPKKKKPTVPLKYHHEEAIDIYRGKK
jgi:hypothetical protein